MTIQAEHPADYAKPFSQARWFDVLPRSAACPAISRRVLLHAGPPFRGALPAPIVNAAVQALIFEGLANDESTARDALTQGKAELQPAQDHGIVVPLAQVVSASMPLAAVGQRGTVRYAPLLDARNPALRFGCAAPECLQAPPVRSLSLVPTRRWSRGRSRASIR